MNLREKIKNYIDSSPARFHMPGHKGKLVDNDITELEFSDNISCPNEGIAEIQSLCAKEYGAKYANLLVNGSTAGILAFQLALAEKTLNVAPKILVSRDCHRSFVNAAILSGAEVVGINPEDELCGVVTPHAIESAFEFHKTKQIDAVFITSPNYYGMCADVEKIAKITHKYGAILFVDSAHGAHFPFSAELPPPAIKYSDYCTVSTHKTLGSLNQSAALLSNSDFLTQKSIQNAINMVQTTSPSYPIVLSIEQGVGEAKYIWDNHCKRIQRFRENLKTNNIPMIDKPKSAKHIDNTRICILAKPFAATGYGLEKKLNAEGIYPEMSDSYCVVILTTPYDENAWYDRLLDALNAMKINAERFEYKQLKFQNSFEFIKVRDALLAPCELIPIEESENRLAKRSIGLYPPGISIVFPNERITSQKIDMLCNATKYGAKPFGIENGLIEVICE